MIRSLIAGALALACAACTTAPATLTPPNPDQVAAARLSAETGYDASLVGVEQSLKSGALTGVAVADARTSLLAAQAPGRPRLRPRHRGAAAQLNPGVLSLAPATSPRPRPSGRGGAYLLLISGRASGPKRQQQP